MNSLLEKRCIDYPPGTSPLSPDQVEELRTDTPEWNVIDGQRIKRDYKFKSYLAGIEWVQRIAEIAESENHHPDIRILWRKVSVELWTHTVKGLSENDFILAAKFDRCYSETT